VRLSKTTSFRSRPLQVALTSARSVSDAVGTFVRIAQVHPPLGKMLVGLAGALSGFNGSFDFPSGVTYPDHVPFHAMRIMLALPGVAMVPLAWGTAVELRFSKWGRHIVTVMVLTGAAALLVSLSSPPDFTRPRL
jgi:hypothetical protein